MNRGSRALTEAERAIACELERLQQRAGNMWRGREKEAVIALVRALDSIAVAKLWDRGRKDGQTAARHNARFFASTGALAALRPFLAVVKDQSGGVPWGPGTPSVTQFSYSYLDYCGKLTYLRRIAALEHYRLASSSFPSPGRLVIRAKNGTAELSAAFAMSAWKNHLQQTGAEGDIARQEWVSLAARMDSYVEPINDWFIRYDNDMEIVSAYRRKAHRYGKEFLEAEALPDDVVIGDRRFDAWKNACDQALGRVLSHIDFASLLQKRHLHLALSNVLTLFARREDVDAVWRQAGLHAELVAPTMKALTLDVDGLEDWENAHETPTPFYVDLGKDFVLLPCFGALTNPYFALFRYLRQVYKPHWDRAVDRRESIFRSDLAKAFPEPDFLVPTHGFNLRRSDGSTLTDLDAVVLDRRSGTLTLVQLKWHDVFGLSLAERESRRRNLDKANEWVGRVVSWVDGRSSAAIARALGLPGQGSDLPPMLYVVARYMGRFSGEQSQDVRASWLGWPEVLHAIDRLPRSDILRHIPRAVFEHQAKFTSRGSGHTEFKFPELIVDLHVL